MPRPECKSPYSHYVKKNWNLQDTPFIWTSKSSAMQVATLKFSYNTWVAIRSKQGQLLKI